MARTPSSQRAEATSPAGLDTESMSALKAEQALALIGMGLMRKLASEGESLPWEWMGEEEPGGIDAPALRQRLELVDLALRTSAPLSTAEVTHLMGARPGSSLVERGGLLARRVARNVWILSRSGADSSETGRHFQETPRRRF